MLPGNPQRSSGKLSRHDRRHSRLTAGSATGIRRGLGAASSCSVFTWCISSRFWAAPSLRIISSYATGTFLDSLLLESPFLLLESVWSLSSVADMMNLDLVVA